MNPIKQLAGETAVYGLSSIVPKFLNYLLVPLYTRIFIPEVYGIVTEMYAYVTFLIIILTYGMETGFFRFANSEKDVNKVYGTCFISIVTTSLIFAFCVIINAQHIANFLHYYHHKEYITWFALILSLDAITAIPYVRLRQENKAFLFAGYRILSVVLNIGFNIFFLIICRKYFSHHPDSVLSFLYSKKIGVGYVFISNLLANIINFICMLPIIFKSKLEFNFKLWKRIIAYSLPLLIAGFGGNMNEAADRVLLKYLLPSNVNSMEQLGLFGANIKVAVLMTLFIQMFRFAAEPFFFNREKDKNSKKLFADVTKYFIIFGLFIFLGVTLYMGIVKYFIGVEYRKGLFIVPTLLMANLFLGIYFNLSMWYKLNNMTKFGAILAIVGAVITLAINIIFVPIYGYGACAWAHLFCYLGMVSLSYYLSRKYYLIKYDFKNITFYFILALSLFFISKFVGIKSLLLNLVFNTFLLAIYVWIVMKKEGLKKLFVKP